MNKKIVKALREEVLAAARRYADDSQGGSEHGALASGATLRLVAKRMREAERAAGVA